jgi:hypothetical protein
VKTVNNTTVLEAGDIDKVEYRAAAKAALLNGGSVSIPHLGLSLHMVNTTTVEVVDLAKGEPKQYPGKTAEAVMDCIASYKTTDRILAFLGA